MTTVLAWLRGHVGWLALVALAAGWAGVQQCRADGAARELAAARAEVGIARAEAADVEARHVAAIARAAEDAGGASQRAAADAEVAAERAAAEARADAVAEADLAPIAADEVHGGDTRRRP